MRYDIMNSELGSILFGCDDKGITRVHFLDSVKSFQRDESWRQTGQDPLLQETGRQLKAYHSLRKVLGKTYIEIDNQLDLEQGDAKEA